MSSRLFMSVREEHGLAYMIKSMVSKYQDTGNLMIQAGLDRSRLHEAIKVIFAELEKLKSQEVDEQELRRAKDYFEGKTSIALEDSSAVAQWYAEQELLTKTISTPKEEIEKIMSVTAADIKSVANRFVKKE